MKKDDQAVHLPVDHVVHMMNLIPVKMPRRP